MNDFNYQRDALPLFWDWNSDKSVAPELQLLLAPVNVLSIPEPVLMAQDEATSGLPVALVQFTGFLSNYYEKDELELGENTLMTNNNMKMFCDDFVQTLLDSFVAPISLYLSDFTDLSGNLAGDWRKSMMSLETMTELVMRETSTTQLAVEPSEVFGAFINWQTSSVDYQFLCSPDNFYNAYNQAVDMITKRRG